MTVLGVFKYLNFFIQSFAALFRISNIHSLNIILPIGISFYTFQSLSYVIDVYRGKIHARESMRKVYLYICFFPQLVAGPIVRAADFLPQLDENKELTKENFSVGAQIFLFGLIKKIVIADRLAVCVDSVFFAPGAYSGSALLCAVISYSIQIYCDFSGYSDMAIGIAKIFGYELTQNFNVPYLAQNPTEFWRRWHISLSGWLRDYLYIPLGGNRKGGARTYINLFLTMLLGGLWHGASWNFVFWGAYHGLALCIHKIFMSKKNKSSTGLFILKKPICIFLNIIFVSIGWIFFRCQTMTQAVTVLRGIFTWQSGIKYIYIYTIVYGLLIFVCYIVSHIRNGSNGFYPILNLQKFWTRVLLWIVIWLILAFFYAGDTAFIYFQF